MGEGIPALRYKEVSMAAWGTPKPRGRLLTVHGGPFRLGLSTYRYGVVVKWRGLYRAIGRRS